jgi:hypothetical protein
MSHAWPELVADMFGIKLEALLACSGATTAALASTYKDQPSQLQSLGAVKAPTLVTVTMGGDDPQFSYLIESCFTPVLGNCQPHCPGLRDSSPAVSAGT